MIINRVTLLGNKDHGKSTLIGNLLIKTNSVSEQRINDAKKTSRKLGRKFEPGYILDSFEEERLNEMTIDSTRAQVKYKNNGFEFIDVPGHEELMKNMLSGASYADFALLLVSAKKNEGITDQTKRHLFLAKLMGINKMIVAVNKLDAVNYNKGRFDEITNEIARYLERIGFKADGIFFVPISAYDSENLIKKSTVIKWYRGRSLIDTLVQLSKSRRTNRSRDLIILLQGMFEGDERSVFGRVISGRVKKGEKVVVLPAKKEAKIIDIFVSGKRKSFADNGNVVTLRLNKTIGSYIKGSVICNNEDACKTSNTINALFFDTKPIRGRASIKMNGVEIPCQKLKIERTMDVVKGNTKKGGSLKPLHAAYVQITLDRKIPIENFDKVPEIGRFVLYSNNNFSGIGVIQ